jgi:hypothetical protein
LRLRTRWTSLGLVGGLVVLVVGAIVDDLAGGLVIVVVGAIVWLAVVLERAISIAAAARAAAAERKRPIPRRTAFFFCSQLHVCCMHACKHMLRGLTRLARQARGGFLRWMAP